MAVGFFHGGQCPLWRPEDLGPTSDSTGMWAGSGGPWPPLSLSCLAVPLAPAPLEAATAELNPYSD